MIVGNKRRNILSTNRKAPDMSCNSVGGFLCLYGKTQDPGYLLHNDAKVSSHLQM